MNRINSTYIYLSGLAVGIVCVWLSVLVGLYEFLLVRLFFAFCMALPVFGLAIKAGAFWAELVPDNKESSRKKELRANRQKEKDAMNGKGDWPYESDYKGD